jgi:hypothetical protein
MYIKYVKTCFKFSTFVFHYILSRDLTMNFRSYSVHVNHVLHIPGADPARGASGARPPLKLEKIWFFWRKIVIFHTKYPKNFRASLRSAHFFKVHPPPPPNLKSWIRPCCQSLIPGLTISLAYIYIYIHDK